MKSTDKTKTAYVPVRRYTIITIVIWTLLLTGSLVWNILNERQQTRELAFKEADSIYNKDQAFRQWGITHGGVYVVPDARTPPNPYLKHVPDRDIITTTGKKYTLMNPAYMMRQMMAEYSDAFGARTRITSLKVLNPINKPDEWEINALRAFDQGKKEVVEFIDIDGEPYLRLMRPMKTRKACLKCHGFQGYKVGDVRGGVDVSVPMKPYMKGENKNNLILFLTHGLIWMMGLQLIGFISIRSKKQINENRQYEISLKKERDFSDHVINGLPGIFCIFDRNGKMIQWNDNMLQVTGYSSDELSTKNVMDLHSEDTREIVLKFVNEVVERGESSIEADILAKDGRVIPYYISGIRFDIEGVDCIVGTGIDITRQKTAEQELTGHKEHLEELVNERTVELRRVVSAMSGREIRMSELKKVISRLIEQLKEAGLEPASYDPLNDVHDK